MQSASTRSPLLSWVHVGVSPFLTLALLVLAASIVYVVGLEPLPLVHDAFHDLRHAAGFPCH